MTRQELIEKLYEGYESDSYLSQKTQDLSRKFFEVYYPKTNDNGEKDDFFQSFYIMTDSIMFDAFKLGFHTAMKLRDTSETGVQ